MIMMCGPTWNSGSLPVACDVLGTQKPPYMYEMPIFCTLGVRTGNTVLDELQKDLVEAAGLIVPLTQGVARETCPFVLAQHTILTIGCDRPVEERCILRNEGRASPECIRDLLGICNGHSRLRCLREGGGCRDRYNPNHIHLNSFALGVHVTHIAVAAPPPAFVPSEHRSHVVQANAQFPSHFKFLYTVK